jgi:hypothetical protein
MVLKAPSPDPGIKMLQDYIAAQEKARHDKAAARQKEKDDAAAAAAAAAKKAEEDKLDALQKLILEHNKAQLEREKQRIEEWESERKKKEEAEKAAAEAKRIQGEKDKEIKAAAERATLEAEKKAAEDAAKKKEEHDTELAKKKEEYDKELEEAKKKAQEFEEGQKKAEAEAKSLRPGDDMTKAPIRFKDAVGRKFAFPWHLCKTWKVYYSHSDWIPARTDLCFRVRKLSSSKLSCTSMLLDSTFTTDTTISSVLMARSFFHKYGRRSSSPIQ